MIFTQRYFISIILSTIINFNSSLLFAHTHGKFHSHGLLLLPYPFRCMIKFWKLINFLKITGCTSYNYSCLQFNYSLLFSAICRLPWLLQQSCFRKLTLTSKNAFLGLQSNFNKISITYRNCITFLATPFLGIIFQFCE